MRKRVITGVLLLITAGVSIGFYWIRKSGDLSHRGLIAIDTSLVARHGQSPEKLALQFRVLNAGRRPVRILSVESGCGCTSPEFDRKPVAPGKEATVVVHANPQPVGEKVVPIRVRTDSPSTPTIGLEVRMQGSEEPPFLLRVDGDLTYRGAESLKQRRTFRVLTVETSSKERTPVPSTDVPSLHIVPERVSEKPYGQSGAILRVYTFAAEFEQGMAEQPFRGELTVPDPWHAGRSERLVIDGQLIPTVRIVPDMIRVERAPAASKLMLILKAPAPECVLEPEKGEKTPLVFEMGGTQGRVVPLLVRARTGKTVAPGVHRLVFRRSPTSEERLIVSLTVLPEASDDSAK